MTDKKLIATGRVTMGSATAMMKQLTRRESAGDYEAILDEQSDSQKDGENSNNTSSNNDESEGLYDTETPALNKQKTVDPSKMGNHDSRMLDESESLSLKPQKSMKPMGHGGNSSKSNQRKKHNRRTAKEINRQYICPYKNCQKIYGSEGSLNLHIKIKHNGGNKTDRERLAKTIIIAHMKGHLCQVIDQIDLNLPPGTISKAAKKFGLTGQVEH